MYFVRFYLGHEKYFDLHPEVRIVGIVIPFVF